MRSDPSPKTRPTAAAPKGGASVKPAKRPRAGLLAALVLGLGAGAVVDFSLPTSVFQTHAIVEIGTSDPTARLALAQGAAEAVTSKPVMLRAAGALAASAMSIPDPALGERIGVAVGLSGAHATGRDARLAEALVSMVHAVPGDSPGTVDIIASDADAEQAARVANTVAESFVADQEDRAADLRRQREIETVKRIASAKANAVAAHARFTALGGMSVDPAQARAAAAAQTATAQARLDAIHAIIASGSPPLSDRKDVPGSVASLQTAYLDLTAQLAKARETLGDRHTTIISLKDGIQRAAANLTAEWKRMQRIAEAEVSTARDREVALRKADMPADAARRTAIDAARDAAQRADELAVRAESTLREVPASERPYRLLARAPVPSVSSGLSSWTREPAAALAGFSVMGVALMASGRRRRGSVPVRAPAPKRSVSARDDKAKSSFFDEGPLVDRSPVDDRDRDDTMMTARVPSNTRLKPHGRSPARVDELGLAEAIREIDSRLDIIDPQFGLPTIIVGANESDAGTTSVALSIGRALSAAGRRVLLVETPRPEPELAAATDEDAEPILVDVFGTLRVALRAETEDGLLYLAPALRNGARIASTLARKGDAVLIDDLTDDFDVVVIDGGRAGTDDIAADVYLRVGRFTSRRDDARFLASLGAVAEAFVGTIIGGVFVPGRAEAPETASPVIQMSSVSNAAVPPPRAAVRRPAAERVSMPRRRVAAR